LGEIILLTASYVICIALIIFISGLINFVEQFDTSKSFKDLLQISLALFINNVFSMLVILEFLKRI
jgi:hypothetical protein